MTGEGGGTRVWDTIHVSSHDALRDGNGRTHTGRGVNRPVWSNALT